MSNLINIIEKELMALAAQIAENKRKIQEDDNKTLWRGFLQFTKKEIAKMHLPTNYIITNDTLIPYKVRTDKNSRSMEIRFQRDGFRIFVSATTESRLKERFVAEYKRQAEEMNNPTPKTAETFFLFYFEEYRKEAVTPATYKTDVSRLNNHIIPYFGSMRLDEITPKTCKDFFNSLGNMGKTRDECRSLLNLMFTMAIAHHVMPDNPLNKLLKFQHERISGKRLTLLEESELLALCKGTKFEIPMLLMLYCGLRPNEITSVQFIADGKIIKAIDSKQKKGKIKYKRIPVSPMLKPYFGNLTVFPKFPCYKTIATFMYRKMPNHSLKDLRITFNSHCHECGVQQEVIDEMMGHSKGKLDEVYNQMSDDFLIKEAQKIKY